jgi:2-phospho-L-lactate guanylyltransferase
MKAWHAIVPLKQGTAAKSRLSGVLTPQQRQLLSDAMARHVLSVLERCHLIAELSLLAPNPLQGWQGRWVRDVGIGLNAALERWSNDQIGAKRLIIHADLPLLSPEDVDGFLAGAEKAGGAMATDRAGTGTNAMALPAGPSISALVPKAGACTRRKSARGMCWSCRAWRSISIRPMISIAFLHPWWIAG